MFGNNDLKDLKTKNRRAISVRLFCFCKIKISQIYSFTQLGWFFTFIPSLKTF